MEGKNLPAADSNGLSDPYVEIKSEKGLFVRDGSVKTSVRNETLNPKVIPPLLININIIITFLFYFIIFISVFLLLLINILFVVESGI